MTQSNACNVYHYLPVNDAALAWGIYLTSIGRQTVPPGARYPIEEHPDLYDFRWERGRTLPEFQAVLITGGRGMLESERTGPLDIPDNSIFFLFPGVWHRYRPLQGSGWTQRWIGLNGAFMHHIISQSLVQPEFPVHRVANPDPLAATYDALLDRVHANPSQNSILLSLHVLGTLAAVFDATVSQQLPDALQPLPKLPESSDPVVSQAIEFIWTRGHLALSVPQIANSLGLARRTLERRFHAALGRSVLNEIVACRLNRAQRLLIETELPIKAITHLSGFTSEERMRVVFLEQTGGSPTQFRQRKKTATRSSRGKDSPRRKKSWNGME
jgi:AraC-like DNA-binding protein